jgi:hypothetical protein
MRLELKEWLASINETKENLIDADPSLEKDYVPYVINRCLSGHIDCILFANEMNVYNQLDRKLQYDFLINILRKRKRFSPWLKKEKIDDLELVKRHYGYSNEKARVTLNLLNKQQLDVIRTKYDMGGKR